MISLNLGRGLSLIPLTLWQFRRPCGASDHRGKQRAVPPVDLGLAMSYTGFMTISELKRAVVLFSVAALLFLFPTLTGHTLYVGDVTYSFQPWLTYAAQEIQCGRFPLWNPYSACGEPFFSNPQVMLFNPAAILYWIFPFAKANALFLALNQSLLYFFTYFLARRWIGRPIPAGAAAHGPAALAALGLAWGGFAISHWEFPSAIGTLWSLPLFFLLGLDESWKTLTLSWALTFFSGYTQLAYYAAVLAAAGAAHAAFSRQRGWAERGRVFLFLAGSAAIGILLALPQIAVTWENARVSLRATMDASTAGAHLLTPIFLLKFWIPRLTNTVALAFQERTPFGPEFWSIQRNWLATFFLGTPLCVLGVGGLLRGPRAKKISLLAIVAVGAVWAFGIAPFWGWSRTLVPGFRYLTHFANASILIALCLTLAATDMASPRPGRNLWIGLVTATLLAPALALALSSEARTWALHQLLGLDALSQDQDRWVMQSGGTAATAVLTFVGTWLFFRRKRWAALWAMTLLELWLFAQPLQPWGHKEIFHGRPVPVQWHANAEKRFSVSPATMKSRKLMAGTNLEQGYATLRDAFYPNVHLPYRVHQTWSYEVFGVKEFVEFRRRIPDRPGPSAMLDFLGAHTVLSTTELPEPSRLLAQRTNALFYIRPDAMPRVTAVSRAVEITAPEERLHYLATAWDPRREVVLEKAPRFPTEPPADAPRVTHWSDGPGFARASGHGNGWVVRSETFYPGWACWVNGRRSPLFRANHAFQAVPVPKGPWEVRWKFRSLLFEGCLWISLLTALLALAGIPRPAWNVRR